jgi:hypothetical protein
MLRSTFRKEARMRARALAASSCLVLTLALADCGGGHGGGSPGGAGASAAGAGSAATTPPAPTPSLYAGAAAVDITPPPGTPLGGFGGAPRREVNVVTIPLMLIAIAGQCWSPNPAAPYTYFTPSQGTHDPIMARALVLSNGQKKIGIVKLDTIGAARKTRDDLLPIAGQLGIAPEDFLLCATHTHSGPAAVSTQKMWQLIAMDCFSQQVYQTMLTGATDALRAADAALRPAQLGIGVTTEPAGNENRRGRPGIVDPELGLVKITDAAGAPICALFNYAVHGTCSGANNLLFSADCMGEMERTIERGLGAGVAIFTNGAEGDVAPAIGGGFGGAAAEGALVGGDVVALWPSVATKQWVELQTAFEDVAMPPPVYNTGCFPVPGTTQTLCDFIPGFRMTVPLDTSWLSTTLPFQAIRIDDTVFACEPGEPITELGWDIKARAKQKGFARGFVIGLANDHGSYFTTLSEYIRAEYEGTSTMYGPTTGQVVVDAADRVMERVR